MSDEKSVALRPIGTIDFAKGLTQEQVSLLKETICQGATDDELKLFIYQCEKRRLDPFAKQIYSISRWSAQAGKKIRTSQTAIDGFRCIAERTGKYRGQIGPEWCGKDGVWKDVWLEQIPPAAARVGILREGCSGPIWGVALWREYVQTNQGGQPSGMWADMPANQLAKCAEALGLRKAFPEDLSGIYTDDEMGQADNTATRSKAEETQRGIEGHKEGGPSTLHVHQQKDPGPALGDPVKDWIVPPFVKPIAGERLGNVPLEKLRETVKWARGYFDREKKEPHGGWATFFDMAVARFEQERGDLPKSGVIEAEFKTVEEAPEPGSNG